MTNIKALLNEVKNSAHLAAQLDLKTRDALLLSLSQALIDAYDDIIDANKKDLILMDKSDPKYDRLLLDKKRIDQIANETRKIASLQDPLNFIIHEKKLANGLMLKKVAVPLGVVAVIYESRPNVTIDVFSLCIKAGNACVLKGGKEAFHTNHALINIVHRVLEEYKIPTSIALLFSSSREETSELLSAVGLIDVCIPRGSQELINFVRENAKIPVIETGAGIVHTYFDKDGDIEKAKNIIFNAKTRRVSVCNALDTLVIHQARLADLYQLVEPLALKQVEIYADSESYQALSKCYPDDLLFHARETDFGKEFLSYKMAIKTVQSFDEAVFHIRTYSSSHSEAIISEDLKTCDEFMRQIDAAAVYANASTAFTDGGEFGMGAEIGISTQKLHARGPMGLEALTCYKWLIYGNGQVREN